MTQFIYVLLDSSNEPFYVGKTNNPRRRLSVHMALANRGETYYVSNKIRQMVAHGQTPILTVIEETDDAHADERERCHISQLRTEGVKLCNLTNGGKGGCTSESARKGGETRRRNGTSSRSQQTKDRMSVAAKGKPKSELHKEALKRAWHRTPERIATQSAKSAQTSKGRINIKIFVCIAPDGTEYITERGLTSFCEQHGLIASNLHQVLNGKRRHCKGWGIRRYEDE